MNTQLQRFYDKGFDWLLTVGPRLVFAILVLTFGLWIIRIIRRKLNAHLGKKKMYSSLRPFIESLVFAALHIALIFFIMQILGIRLTVFAALIAAFGAAAGLALSGTLQNFASGVLILLLKPFKAGDDIAAQNLEGTVTSIQIFYTIITTFDNRTVIMPNSKLSNEVIINITHEGSRRLDIAMKFNYGQDINQAKDVIMNALSSFPEVLKDPAYRAGVSIIEPDGYTLVISIWVNAHGLADARLRINEKIIDAIKASGIKLPGM